MQKKLKADTRRVTRPCKLHVIVALHISWGGVLELPVAGRCCRILVLARVALGYNGRCSALLELCILFGEVQTGSCYGPCRARQPSPLPMHLVPLPQNCFREQHQAPPNTPLPNCIKPPPLTQPLEQTPPLMLQVYTMSAVSTTSSSGLP